MFDKDPYELVDDRRFLFVKAEFAQGIHLVTEGMMPIKVLVDHLPANIDLIN